MADDAKVRLLVERRGLKVRGCMGLLIEAAKGLLERVEARRERETRFYVIARRILTEHELHLEGITACLRFKPATALRTASATWLPYPQHDRYTQLAKILIRILEKL